jgi:NADH:ubiquinone oxidoreductase subunit 6 (subunit J)
VSFWVGILVFAGVLFATAAMVVRAIQIEQWNGAVVVALFFAVFAFQLGNYFRRNRPVRYRPDALPDKVLPVAQK